MILDDLRKKVKRNNFLYFTYSKIADHNYRSGFAGYLVKKNFKHRDRVRDELSLIKDYWQCDPAYYFRYRLYEKDLSGDELLDYIPPYYFYNFYMPSLYRDEHINLTDSKIRMNEFFKSRKIATPAIVGTIRNGIIHDSGGSRINYDDFKKILLRSGGKAWFIKPDGGRGGKGIIKIERFEDELFINDDFLYAGLLQNITEGNTYVVQEGIVQRSDLKKIYPFSVNTLRIITQYFNNTPRIVAVVLRMGRNGSFVDNSSFGGVFSPVDINTGKINEQACLLHDPEKFASHPDTGFSFKNFRIADFENIKEKVLGYVACAPEFPDVAWDIALLEDRIMAIEINLNYGLDQLQCSIGGMRRKLNIQPLVYYNR
ncbi:MAG TPA: sugar-transfer associated ATP-grasp domain-containing protein [Bacteroidales bacterium]|nr:sugar-transfer associated ATP-grasp domain-containing protein [Bacteroidales bacterium]